MSKLQALIHFLECAPSEIQINGSEYEMGTRSYIVMTDREADRAARDSIFETVWAFRPEFLEKYTVKGVNAHTLKLLQQRYEDSNTAILNLIRNKKDLVCDAIQTDGRGHFLSGYDGKEHEVEHNGTTYYIYRTN